MPDDIDVVELLRLRELVHVLGQGIGVIAATRDARLSYAAQIQRHHRESLGQSRHDGAIFAPILRKAMDEDQSRSRASTDEMQPHAVHVGHARGETGRNPGGARGGREGRSCKANFSDRAGQTEAETG